MRKALSAAVACVVLGTGLIAQPAAAQRYNDRDRYVSNYCSNHPRDRDCRDWNNNRHGWNEDRYHRWYGNHRREFGPDDAAASIFGFAAGVTGAIVRGATGTGHVVACETRYRSYNSRTDMFMGHDGDWHRCRL